MISWSTLLKLIAGKPAHPDIKSLQVVENESLFFESLTMGTIYSGKQGSGKTSSVARTAVDYALCYTERPIFIFDASGSLIEEFIKLYHLLPQEQFEKIGKRVVLDIPGDDEYVIPKPLFSPDYGLSLEEEIDKAKSILMELNPERLERNPTMATAITVTAPHLFRLLNVIRDDHGSWQVPNAKTLLYGAEPGDTLDVAISHYGRFAKSSADHFRRTLLRENISSTTRTAKVDALLDALQEIEPDPLRARYGYVRPGITPREIIDKGLIYLLSGEKLTNNKTAQAWVFWDEFSSLRAIINQRIPHDDNEAPVLLIIDEVYRLFEIKGMAEALGEIPTYFRSRKLMPIFVIQAHWQLANLLKEQIWNMGNLVTFSLFNFDDAYRFAQQVFEYDKEQVRLSPFGESGQFVAETDRGQYLQIANWIQRLPWRQAVMRRYITEQESEPFVAFVERTRELPSGRLPRPMSEIKRNLFRRRAIPVRDALNVVNHRKLVHRYRGSQDINQERPVER